MNTQLINFTPVQPGWVIAESLEDGSKQSLVTALLGWATYKVDDGTSVITTLTPIDAVTEAWDYTKRDPHAVFWAPRLFASVQLGGVVMTNDGAASAIAIEKVPA